MEKRVVDVLLIRAHDEGRASDDIETEDVLTLMENRVQLSQEGCAISVGWDAALPSLDEIVDCCLPSWRWNGQKNVQPTRQFGVHCGLINEQPARPADFNWDPDYRLTEFVAISRIVHPSAVSFEYCARLRLNANGQWDIIPTGGLPNAYVRDKCRTFLLIEEWRRTAELVAKWRWRKQNSPNHRLTNALFWREKSAQEYYMHVRWPTLVTAIESLVKLWDQTGTTAIQPSKKQPSYGSTENFVRGVRFLAKEVGIAYTKEEARLAYEIRGSHAHGREWPIHRIRSYLVKNGQPAVVANTQDWVEAAEELYEKTQSVFDRATQKAIQDDSLFAVFNDDTLLASHLARAI